jgi:hypothetical protein
MVNYPYFVQVGFNHGKDKVVDTKAYNFFS